MTLKPLRRNQFDCLRKLLEQRLKESHLEKLTSADYIIPKLEGCYDIRSAGAYVDDVDNPKHCLIMTHFQSAFIDGVAAFVSLLYSVPEARGNPEDLAVLFQTAENYARLNGCIRVTGSSWIFEGSKGIDALWLKKGYKPQETVFVKSLT
jgi:hypothetical protein